MKLNAMKQSFFNKHSLIFVVYGLIMVLMVIGALNSERFLSIRNLTNVLRQAAYLGTAALGEMLVILTAGIDLSIGSLVKLCVLVSAILMDGNPDNVWMAVFLTLGLGISIGLIHAFLINEFNLSPFVVTFASLFILHGISLTITTKPIGRASRDFLMLYSQKLMGIPIIVYYFLSITLLVMFLLRKTVFGKHIYAIGGNLSVAQLSGIPVKKVRYGVYALCSLLAASTGLLWLMRMGVGDPVIGKELELNAIIAVVIGGTSLFGGRGTVIGVLGGVLLLTFTDNLLVVLGVNQFMSGLIKGIIFVTAVALYKQEDRSKGGFSGP
jgi:ribose/xylose/arabinose/galactoside ABC-type transport system permease subunit